MIAYLLIRLLQLYPRWGPTYWNEADGDLPTLAESLKAPLLLT